MDDFFSKILNLFFQKTEVNLTLFFFFLGGFFQRNLYLYSAPVSLKISVLLLDQFENQEKKSKNQMIRKFRKRIVTFDQSVFRLGYWSREMLKYVPIG